MQLHISKNKIWHFRQKAPQSSVSQCIVTKSLIFPTMVFSVLWGFLWGHDIKPVKLRKIGEELSDVQIVPQSTLFPLLWVILLNNTTRMRMNILFPVSCITLMFSHCTHFIVNLSLHLNIARLLLLAFCLTLTQVLVLYSFESLRDLFVVWK